VGGSHCQPDRDTAQLRTAPLSLSPFKSAQGQSPRGTRHPDRSRSALSRLARNVQIASRRLFRAFDFNQEFTRVPALGAVVFGPQSDAAPTARLGGRAAQDIARSRCAATLLYEPTRATTRRQSRHPLRSIPACVGSPTDVQTLNGHARNERDAAAQAP
jgi:hypothetical protein